LLFDTGPIISLTTNNLLWILPELQKKFQGDFSIVESVRYELVGKPLATKKFKFEALQVQRLIQDNAFKVLSSPNIQHKAQQLFDVANRIFRVRKQPLRIVQMGEMETLAAVLVLGASGMVCDERITRTLVEAPHALRKLYEHRLHEKVDMDMDASRQFSTLVKGVKIIRSVELVTLAFELGILNKFLVSVPNAKRALLESLLWGVKLHGAAVSEEEIAELVKLEIKK
ncbi:MAG TPA: hypothetical protein VLJ21_04995, partial [Candidatus Binatia bacterium]|nr:hypothetical protein [Candidatus Binatia bacterium]